MARRRDGRYEVSIEMAIEDKKVRKAGQTIVQNALLAVAHRRSDEEYVVTTSDEGLLITVRPIRAASEDEALAKAKFKIRDAAIRTQAFSWSGGDGSNEGATVREMEAA